MVEYGKLTRETKYGDDWYYFKGEEVGRDLMLVLGKLGKDGWQIAMKEDKRLTIMQRVTY